MKFKRFDKVVEDLCYYHGYSKYQLQELTCYIKQSTIDNFIKYNSPDYKTYLSSEKWKETKIAMKLNYKVCQECGSENDLCVHHINYENFGNESIDDITLLCRKCHDNLHKLIKKMK